MTNALLLLLALLGPLQDEAPSSPVTLTFGWPAEGSVRVREQARKNDAGAVMSYVLRWSPAEEGEGLLLAYTDFLFLEIDGEEVTTPAMRSAVRQAEVLASAIPSLRIGADGALLGIEEFGEMLERLIAHMASDGSLEPEKVDQVARAMREPSVRDTMEAKCSEFWQAWVGVWAGLELERGTDEVWHLDVEETKGVTRELLITYGERTHHRGLECVEIEMEGDADEQLIREKTLAMVGLLAEGADQELPKELPFARMTRTDRTHGIWALDGLRPLEVLTSSTVSVWQSADGEPEVQAEEHHYFFEWEDLDPAPEGESVLR